MNNNTQSEIQNYLVKPQQVGESLTKNSMQSQHALLYIESGVEIYISYVEEGAREKWHAQYINTQ